MSDDEAWVACHYGLYEVSSLGRVRRKSNARIRSTRVGRSGYLTVSLKNRGNDSESFVHSLVAAAFIGPRPTGLQVNHVNGNKLDNRAANLEYVTPSENIRHAVATGLHHGPAGEINGQAKLRDGDVLEIRRLRASGVTLSALADHFSVAQSTVCQIARRQRWSHL